MPCWRGVKPGECLRDSACLRQAQRGEEVGEVGTEVRVGVRANERRENGGGGCRWCSGCLWRKRAKDNSWEGVESRVFSCFFVFLFFRFKNTIYS